MTENTNQKKENKAKQKRSPRFLLISIIISVVVVILGAMVVIGLFEMNSFKSCAKEMKAELKNVVYCVKDDDFQGAEQAMDEVDATRMALHDKINDPFWTMAGKVSFLKEDMTAVNELLDILDTTCADIIHPFIDQAKAHPLSDLKAEGGFNVTLIDSYLDFAEVIIPTVDEIAERINTIEFGPLSRSAVGDYTDKITS